MAQDVLGLRRPSTSTPTCRSSATPSTRTSSRRTGSTRPSRETYLPLLRDLRPAHRRGHPLPHLDDHDAAAGRDAARRAAHGALRAPARQALRARRQGGPPDPQRPDLPRAGPPLPARVPASSAQLFDDRYHRDLVARLPPAGGGRAARDRHLRRHPRLPAAHAAVPGGGAGPDRGGGRAPPAPLRPRPGGHLAAGVRLLPRRWTRSLAEQNIRYFFVDTHGITDATPRPRYGVYAPIYTPSPARPPSAAIPSRRSRSGAPRPATPATPTTASSTGTSAGTSTSTT